MSLLHCFSRIIEQIVRRTGQRGPADCAHVVILHQVCLMKGRKVSVESSDLQQELHYHFCPYASGGLSDLRNDAFEPRVGSHISEHGRPRIWYPSPHHEHGSPLALPKYRKRDLRCKSQRQAICMK